MKIKREVIIVTISVITVIICVALTRISNMQTPTSISSETYIGVMATLIGVCATIIVGFQIAHFLELRDLRDQIDELNKVKMDINKKAIELQNNLSFVKIGVSSAFRVFYRKFKNDPLASVACIIAIIAYDTKDIKQASITLLGNYQKLFKMLSQPECNKRLARKYLNDLKKLEFPKELENRSEICRLHYNIISILEKK